MSSACSLSRTQSSVQASQVKVGWRAAVRLLLLASCLLCSSATAVCHDARKLPADEGESQEHDAQYSHIKTVVDASVTCCWCLGRGLAEVGRWIVILDFGVVRVSSVHAERSMVNDMVSKVSLACRFLFRRDPEFFFNLG